MQGDFFRRGPLAPLLALGGLTILVVLLAQHCVFRPVPSGPAQASPAVSAPPR